MKKLILAILLCLPTSLYAEDVKKHDARNLAFFNGNMLYSYLSSDSDYWEGFGYILGVTDALTYDGNHCREKAITTGQIKDVVIAYLEKHPEERHYSAPSIIYNALQEALPCNK